jgi:hypothetical protein
MPFLQCNDCGPNSTPGTPPCAIDADPDIAVRRLLGEDGPLPSLDPKRRAGQLYFPRRRVSRQGIAESGLRLTDRGVRFWADFAIRRSALGP